LRRAPASGPLRDRLDILLECALGLSSSSFSPLRWRHRIVSSIPTRTPAAAARFSEHRMFQQAVVRHRVGDRLDLSHRYRLEQRFIGSAATQTAGSPEGRNWRYENCFRSMLRGTIPLRRGSDWYAALYDEIFVNFGRNVAANVFDQNRAYAAPGRKAGSWGRIEVGYMHQLVQQRSGRVLESNHTVQIAWFSTSPLR
jgi:hypothetical protein